MSGKFRNSKRLNKYSFSLHELSLIRDWIEAQVCWSRVIPIQLIIISDHGWRIQPLTEIIWPRVVSGPDWVDATHAVGIRRTPWQLLLGMLGLEAVCCGLLYVGQGLPGF